MPVARGILNEDVPNLLAAPLRLDVFGEPVEVLCCPITTRSAVFSGFGGVSTGFGNGGGEGLLKKHIASSPKLIQ